MKANIIIKGQLGGNSKLLYALPFEHGAKKNLPFNNYAIAYNSKSEAQKALSEAWGRLKRNEPEYCRKGSNQAYMRRHNSRPESIIYDASKAVIIED